MRVLLTGLVLIAMLVVGARLAGIALDSRESASLDSQRTAVESIARDSAGLLVLTQDYLLHVSPRAARQWSAVHGRLTSALKTYAAVGPLQAGEAADLLEISDDLPGLFLGLQAAMTGPKGLNTLARREALADQFVSETRRISDGAFDISHELTERAQAANQQQRL